MSLPLPGDQMELGFGSTPVVVAVATARERHQSAVRWVLSKARPGVPVEGEWLVSAASARGITAAEVQAAREELVAEGVLEESIEPVLVRGARSYVRVLRLVPFRRRSSVRVAGPLVCGVTRRGRLGYLRCTLDAGHRGGHYDEAKGRNWDA